MKAAVAVPPVLDFYFTPSRASALGAEAVRTILEAFGIRTEVYNFPAGKTRPCRTALPEELEYLKEYMIEGESGPVSFFSKYSRFGPDIETCAEIIVRSGADILFISCFAWAYAEETAALAGAVRKRLPDLPIAAGGAGVSVNPDYFRDCGYFSHILTGEAEAVLPDFLGSLFPGIRGPALYIPSPGFYWRTTGISAVKNIRYISAVLTRGCPKNCRFCSNSLVHGAEFRKVSLELLASEMTAIPREMRLSVNFEDDNLLIDPEYFAGVTDLFRARFPGVRFSAENGLDYTLLTDEILAFLIDTGFTSFNLSMASADEALLKNENRRADYARLSEVINSLRSRRIKSVTYFICGLAEETPAGVNRNLLFLHHLPTLTGISMFYPVPGLPGFDREYLNRFPPRLCAGSSARPWNNCLSTAQLITAFRLARLSNTMKTLSGKIEPPPAFNPGAARGLVEKITSSGRLFTLKDGNPLEVPGADGGMVDAFLKGAAAGACAGSPPAIDYLPPYS